jgi:hypothetical protein
MRATFGKGERMGRVKGYLVRLAGIGFAVLVLASEVLKGDSPSPNAPAPEIVAFLVDGRTGILAGAYVQMLALFLAAFAIVSVTGWPDGVADRLARLGLVLTLVAYTAYVFPPQRPRTARPTFPPEL